MKALISLSGGMDSATVLGEALAHNKKCTGVGFYYGSKHNGLENIKANKLAKYYNIDFGIINLESAFVDFESNLLKDQKEIPEGHYQDESMKLTVVPGRNLIFISILAGLAESMRIPEIWLGIHAGDHAIYPDCRPNFFEAAKKTVELSSEGKVTLKAPFLNMSKTDILKYGIQLGVPYKHTRTCYKDQPIACGKCGSCTERLEAFAALNLTDPVPYEKG